MIQRVFGKKDASSWQRTLAIMFVTQLITAVGFSSIFPFLPLYVKSLGTATHVNIELMVGLVFSSQAFTMMLASPVWGWLADRYGRKLMVERATFGGAVILLLMAFVRSAEELVLLRALQGLITGTISAANALIAASVPRERLGYAMGLLQVGFGGGVALGPLIGGAVADAYGYGAAFYVTAALLAVAGGMILFGVQEPAGQESTGKVERSGFLSGWRSLLSTPGILITFALRFMNQLGRMLFIPILPLFVETLMTDPARVNTFTGLVVGVASGTTTLSAIYLGRLGDRIGHRGIVIGCALISFVLYLLHALASRVWQLLGLQALVGIALGGLLPSVSALLAQYTRQGKEGAVYGLDNSVTSSARALAPMVGVGVAMGLGLRATFVTAAVLYLGAALMGVWGLPGKR